MNHSTRSNLLQIILILSVAGVSLAGCINPATEATDADVASNSEPQPVVPNPAPVVQVPAGPNTQTGQ